MEEIKWITEVMEEEKTRKWKENLPNAIEELKQKINQKKSMEQNKIPRRIYMPDWCKAEKAIYDAMQEVEKLSADIRLTEAIQLLSQAQDKVADYIDELNELADTIKYNQKIK